MHFKTGLKFFAAVLAITLSIGAPAFAEETKTNTCPVKLVIDSEYVDGKVNDPVSRNTKRAYIVCDNAEFHLESDNSRIESADVVFYINEYLDGQDTGIRTRVLKKNVQMNESISMLPDDVYDEDIADGSAYDFVNRCYSVRVYTNAADTKYTDFYFGLVNDSIFTNMYNDMAAKKAAMEEAAKAALPQPSPNHA